MSKAHPPDVRKFMDRHLALKLNAGRSITGVLRGFDPFMNMVLEDCVEETKHGTPLFIGMVVNAKYKPLHWFQNNYQGKQYYDAGSSGSFNLG